MTGGTTEGQTDRGQFIRLASKVGGSKKRYGMHTQLHPHISNQPKLRTQDEDLHIDGNII